jgi:hypothetical protein
LLGVTLAGNDERPAGASFYQQQPQGPHTDQRVFTLTFCLSLSFYSVLNAETERQQTEVTRSRSQFLAIEAVSLDVNKVTEQRYCVPWSTLISSVPTDTNQFAHTADLIAVT